MSRSKVGHRSLQRKHESSADLLVIEFTVACKTLSSLQCCVPNMHLAYLDISGQNEDGGGGGRLAFYG